MIALPVSLVLLATGAWLGVAALGVFALFLFGYRVTRPELWLEVRKAEALLEEEKAARGRIPAHSELHDPGVREIVSAILAARCALEQANVDDLFARQGVSALVNARDALETEAGRLARHADELFVWLSSGSVTELQRKLHRLHLLAGATDDPEAQRSYREATAIRQAHQELVGELTARHRRTIARLQAILALIETLPDRLFRMRLLIAHADDLGAETAATVELERVLAEIDSLDETVDCFRNLGGTSEERQIRITGATATASFNQCELASLKA
jgi:hypothetical protein